MAAFDARTAEKLRGWLFAVVCSSVWEDDLYSLFVRGNLRVKQRAAPTQRMLHSKGVYPPGGPRTLMKCCTACGKWTPPQAVGSRGRCYDCYACGLTAEEAEKIPSSHRYTDSISNKEAQAYLAGEVLRPRRRRRGQFVSDDPRVVGGQIDADGVLHDPWLGSSASPVYLPPVEADKPTA